MIIKTLYLTNFKKHKKGQWEFEPGSNMICGNNYAGKSTLLQAILIGMYGNACAPANAKELISTGAKDFEIGLEFNNGLKVIRTSKESALYRPGEDAPFARGHTAVNKAMAEIIGLDKDTFMKVFASEQGSPQQLLAMEGAALQKFIESVTGMDKLDALLKLANRYSRDHLLKAEGLSALLMTDDEYQAANEDFIKNTKGMECLKGMHELCLNSITTLSDDITEQEKLVKEVEAVHKAINQYESDLSYFKATLAQIPEMVVFDTAPREELIINLIADKNRLKTSLDQQKEYDSVKAMIDSILEPTFIDTVDLESRLDSIIPALSQSEAHFKTRSEAIATVSQSKVELAEIKSNIDMLGELSALEPIAKEIEDAKIELREATSKIIDLKETLQSGICAACSRPYDVHFDRATLEKQLDETVLIKVALADNIESLNSTHRALSSQIRIQEDLTTKATRLEALIVDCQNTIDTTPIFTQKDIDSLKEKKITIATEYSTAIKHNQINDVYRQQIDTLRVKLKAVEDTGRSVSEMAKALEIIEEIIANEQANLSDYKSHNKQAEVNNARRASTQEKIANLAVPEGSPYDLTACYVCLDDSKIRLLALQEELTASRVKLMDIDFITRPLKQKLDSHNSAYEKVIGFRKQAEGYQFISTLLTNSRVNFITQAMATIFSITSEFANMATSGDIECVGLSDDGVISYMENGTQFGKNSASGAQKSIIGLGMKLGIANLVTCNFGALLLDEISADMSEGISLKCALALDSLSEQNITVSHRQMDVAGNVIRL